MGTGRYGIFFPGLEMLLKHCSLFYIVMLFSLPLWILTIFQLILSFTTLLEEQRYKFHAIEHSFDVIL